MIFKCQNCGGNVVYSPEKHKMYCPYCDSEESEELAYVGEENISICPDCGGEIPIKEFTSATQCPYCNNFLILDERVSGAFLPKMLIPFQLGKEACKQALREKFKKNVFAPTDFLSELRLNSVEGQYVPFWFYDYDAHVDYLAEGTKVRSWTTGNMRYTETSYYTVRRDFNVSYQNMPVDASVEMPDDIMDLMEPYDYKQLTDFDPKYMSGFRAERYNMEADSLEDRARKKMEEDSKALAKQDVSGYATIKDLHNLVEVKGEKRSYGLLPVWRYLYSYKGKEYPFYVNGQTGKIVGIAPLSVKKVWAYAGTLGTCLAIILICLGLLPNILL